MKLVVAKKEIISIKFKHKSLFGMFSCATLQTSSFYTEPLYLTYKTNNSKKPHPKSDVSLQSAKELPYVDIYI